MRVKVRFTATYETEVEVNDPNNQAELSEAMCNIDTPENATCSYFGSTFEPVCDESGDKILYWPVDESPITELPAYEP